MVQSQWIFSLLVSSFPAHGDASPSERVKAHRQLRLKRMMLSALYREFDSAGFRRVEEGTHYV